MLHFPGSLFLQNENMATGNRKILEFPTGRALYDYLVKYFESNQKQRQKKTKGQRKRIKLIVQFWQQYLKSCLGIKSQLVENHHKCLAQKRSQFHFAQKFLNKSESVCSSWQGKTYVGYSVQYLTLIKYKGLYDMDSITIETNLESLKKNKTYRQLASTSFDRVKDGQELLIFNESKLEEQDEYSLSYVLSYKIQSQAQLYQEQFRLEKKQQHTFKAFQPFESHYSMVSDNFPEVFLEYQCLNVSSQPLEMKNIEFKVENIMTIQRLQDYQLPIVLAQDECLKIIYKIQIQTQDLKPIYTVLTQKKDLTEYDLRLGNIHLEWGTCGNYNGTQKTCLVRIYPINLRPSKSIEILKETITTIEIDIELGILYDVQQIELVLKLDEIEMKAIKVVGLSQMKLNYRPGERTKRVSLDIIAFLSGVHQIKGIKLQDPKTLKYIQFKNFLNIFVSSKDRPIAKQQEMNLLDLEIPQQSQQHNNLLDLI